MAATTATATATAVDGPAVIEARYSTAARLAANEINPRFEHILDLEHQAQVTKNVAGFIVGDGAAVARQEREQLFAELAKLTPAELGAFGQYRKTHR